MCVFAAYGVQCLAAGCRGSGAGQQGVCPERGMLHIVQHPSSIVRPGPVTVAQPTHSTVHTSHNTMVRPGPVTAAQPTHSTFHMSHNTMVRHGPVTVAQPTQSTVHNICLTT